MTASSFSAGDTLLQPSSELLSRLSDLVNDDLINVLPAAIARDVWEVVEAAGARHEQDVRRASPSLEELKTEQDEDARGSRSYVRRHLLVEIARWARHPKSQRALRRIGLDPLDYSLIALCAGTATYTSSAQIRLLEANPLAANSYLPPHLRVVSPRESTLPFGLELRSASRELSAAANVVFSVAGVAGAVWWVSGSSAGFGPELSILLAILAGLVVLVAEVWLYIAQSSRSADARRLEADARRNETVVGWTGDGAQVNGLEALEKRRAQVALGEGGAEDAGGDDEEDAVADPSDEAGVAARKLEDDLEEMLQPIPAVEIPAAEPSSNPTIRLRRRPLGQPVR